MYIPSKSATKQTWIYIPCIISSNNNIPQYNLQNVPNIYPIQNLYKQCNLSNDSIQYHNNLTSHRMMFPIF